MIISDITRYQRQMSFDHFRSSVGKEAEGSNEEQDESNGMNLSEEERQEN